MDDFERGMVRLNGIEVTRGVRYFDHTANGLFRSSRRDVRELGRLLREADERLERAIVAHEENCCEENYEALLAAQEASDRVYRLWSADTTAFEYSAAYAARLGYRI